MADSLTPAQKSLRASAAAYARWAHEDPTENVRRANRGFQARFLNEVDPDRVLPEAERERRAHRAMKSYMKRLALKSARARSDRRGAA